MSHDPMYSQSFCTPHYKRVSLNFSQIFTKISCAFVITWLRIHPGSWSIACVCFIFVSELSANSEDWCILVYVVLYCHIPHHQHYHHWHSYVHVCTSTWRKPATGLCFPFTQSSQLAHLAFGWLPYSLVSWCVWIARFKNWRIWP